MPLDGNGARLFQGSDGSVAFEGARWSPDGTRIAVVAHRLLGGDSGSWEDSSIRIYRADGTLSPVELEGGHQFAWSPDGTRLAYVRIVGEAGQETPELVNASAAGDDLRVIASDPGAIAGLTWAPDATQVLFVLRNEDAGRLVSVSAAGDAPPLVLTQQPHLFEHTTSNDISWQAVRP